MIRTLYRMAGAAIDAAVRADVTDRAHLAHQAFGRMECDGPDATDILNEIEAEREVFEPLELADIEHLRRQRFEDDFPNQPSAASPLDAPGTPAGVGGNPPADASGHLNPDHALCVLCLRPRGCGCFPAALLHYPQK